MNEKKARDITKARSGGWCELRLPECLGPAETMHHRRKRSQGGPWTPSNLVHLCGDGVRGCHGVITNTRTQYYDAGWLVHSWQDWKSQPIQLFDGFVILGDDGQRYDPPHVKGCSVWESEENDCDCGGPYVEDHPTTRDIGDSVSNVDDFASRLWGRIEEEMTDALGDESGDFPVDRLSKVAAITALRVIDDEIGAADEDDVMWPDPGDLSILADELDETP